MKKLLIVFGVICLFAFTGCDNSSKIELVKGTDYYVRGEFTGEYLDLTKEGYYIDSLNQINAPYFYIICMGEKNTGGYSLNVKEVNKVNDKTEIIIEEIVPSEGDVVTMAITNPTVIVEFPKYQDDITIKTTDGKIYEKLN